MSECNLNSEKSHRRESKTEEYTSGEIVALKGNIPLTVWEFVFFHWDNWVGSHSIKNIKDNVFQRQNKSTIYYKYCKWWSLIIISILF